MQALRRIFFYLMVNIVIIFTISIILQLLGIDHYYRQEGYSTYNLFLFCLIWGMLGSFISLLLSKVTVKLMMGVKVIPENTTDSTLQWLVQTVHTLAKSAGISKMPEVGIYQSKEVNAFATGPSKNSSLVAVSSALLQNMKPNEIQGVLGHEIAHVANGDMVTMTLLQGVINTFVMFFARILAGLISSAASREDSDSSGIYWICTLVFQIILGILGLIVTSYYSRIREYRADQGGARYAGRENMIQALEALKPTVSLVDTKHQSIAAFKISGKWSRALFSTHPSLDDRIERLKKFA